MEIDIERLRYDLISYFGTSTSFFLKAYMDVIEVEKASYEELINIALNNEFDLNDYVVGKSK